VPPPTAGDDGRTPQQKDLWGKSHARIGKILPGFLEDFVAQPEAPAPVPAAPAAAGPTSQVETREEEKKAEQ
jgi:hypothetical protein